MAVLYVAMRLGFPVPGWGGNLTTDYTISGDLIAHRFFRFVLVALGEPILITGATLGQLPASVSTNAAFVVAFIGSALLWWLYSDRDDESGRDLIATSHDPGRLALSAYAYAHIPIVAGIIVTAAADELIITNPLVTPNWATSAVILGGPALYLIGNALFGRALSGRLPRSRLVGVTALAALIPVAAILPGLVLGLATTLVLLAIALWDIRAGRRSNQPAEPAGT